MSSYVYLSHGPPSPAPAAAASAAEILVDGGRWCVFQLPWERTRAGLRRSRDRRTTEFTQGWYVIQSELLFRWQCHMLAICRLSAAIAGEWLDGFLRSKAHKKPWNRKNRQLNLFFLYLYTLMTGSKGQTPIHDTYGWLEEHMPMSTMATVGASLSQLFVDIRTLHLFLNKKTN